MVIGIMQPYLFPYIGYFQLLHAVDSYVVYDNIEYSKKGWINRNRILVNGKDEYISFPLKKDSDYLHINQRFLAGTWNLDKIKLLNKITGAYRKAPFFETVMPVIESCILYEKENLFEFILFSLETLKSYLQIDTPLLPSSSIAIDHSLKNQDKVIAICKALHADGYINPIGGMELYNKEKFLQHQIRLGFLKTGEVTYKQFENPFLPALSVIDVMMFNDRPAITTFLNKEFTLH
jgi:hypothetical protein